MMTMRDTFRRGLALTRTTGVAQTRNPRTAVSGRVLSIAVLAAVTGCADGLTDLNVNPNEPVNVGAEFLLPAAIVSGASRTHGSTLNMDLVGLWVQHYAEHLYTTEDRFEVSDAAISGHWSNFYAGPLRNLYEVVEQGRESERPNVVAVGSVLSSWLMQVITDLWGDAGYSEALHGRDSRPDMTVAYDAQPAIYDGILVDLQAAAAMIEPGGPRIVQGDLIYRGDMDKWRRFANSLRMRAAMRLSHVEPGRAAAEFASAFAAGGFTGNADNAVLNYVDNGVDVHPIFAYERTRNDHSISLTLVDTLKALDDPRLTIYARANASGGYTGTPNGSFDEPPLSEVSRIGTWFARADAPAVIMAWSEVLLLQAEAAERGWISGSAGDLYHQGIAAALNMLGIAQSEIDAYLASPRVQYTGGQQGLNQIALQKWIALYGNGPEAYAEWRRTGVPHLVAGPDALNDGRIPVRLQYPEREHALNRLEVEAAIARQAGASMNTPVWWHAR
jgi:hypothetical protein